MKPSSLTWPLESDWETRHEQRGSIRAASRKVIGQLCHGSLIASFGLPRAKSRVGRDCTLRKPWSRVRHFLVTCLSFSCSVRRHSIRHFRVVRMAGCDACSFSHTHDDKCIVGVCVCVRASVLLVYFCSLCRWRCSAPASRTRSNEG